MGIIVVNRSGRIVFANPAAERLLGLAADEIVQRAFNAAAWHITDHDGRPIPDDQLPFQQVMRGVPRVAGAQLAVESPDGTRVLLFVNAAPLRDECGQPDGMVATVEDASASVRMVGELRAAQEEAEEVRVEVRLHQARKMEAVGQLAGGVAHEFNNLLQVIQGNADLAANGLGADHPARESLAEVNRAVGRATTLVNQLLTFSRRAPLRRERFDVNTAITELEKLTRGLMGAHIELDLRLSSEPRMVHADRSQVQQVLVNLCVNARDAMPDGGTITISASHRERLPEEAEGEAVRLAEGWVCVTVSDTGRGIPREIQDRVFEPFFTTKNVGKGTGLGLSTVHSIVGQHGGSVQFQSKPGGGTTFTVLLPCAGPAPETPSCDGTS